MDRGFEDLLRLLRELPWVRITLILASLAALYWAGQFAGEIVRSYLDLDPKLSESPLLNKAVMIATVIYIGLMALPFMPGIEIGLSMLMIFGAKIALLIYSSTLAALMLAYLAGRFMPVPVSARLFDLLGLKRARDLLQQVAALHEHERSAFLLGHVPSRLAPFLLRHRYLALAILINLPGNMLIGGGGGIAMVAGMTRLFSLPVFLLTIAIAVAPVPLLIYFAQY